MASTTTPLTPAYIVLELVCPSLGMVVANLMFLAPLKDLQKAVTKGVGLGDLNPTPWAMMLGNCLGWTAYGVLRKNWFVFWANYPGFLIACWLNLGAVKLLYANHHQEEARRSLVDFLSSSSEVAAMEHRRRSSQMLEKESLLCDTKNKSDNDGDIATTAALSVEYGFETTSDTNDSSPSSSSISTTDENVVATEQKEVEQQHKHDWAKIVWDVTSQTTPAKTPHERLVVFMVLVWTVVLSAVGFYFHYTTAPAERTALVAQSVVGYVVNGNLVFFYGAPLSKIQTVLKTKKSNSLHLPTMVMNTSNAVFWTAYAIATNDAFIYAPNGLGVVLGTIQFLLWMVFPKTKEGDGEEAFSTRPSGSSKQDEKNKAAPIGRENYDSNGGIDRVASD